MAGIKTGVVRGRRQSARLRRTLGKASRRARKLARSPSLVKPIKKLKLGPRSNRDFFKEDLFGL